MKFKKKTPFNGSGELGPGKTPVRKQEKSVCDGELSDRKRRPVNCNRQPATGNRAVAVAVADRPLAASPFQRPNPRPLFSP